MSTFAILISAVAGASVAVNIGTVLVLLKFRKKLKKYERAACDYAQHAQMASDVADDTLRNLLKIFHNKFDKKERVLDETIKHAQALSDTMVDAFHHRLDAAIRAAKNEAK